MWCCEERYEGFPEEVTSDPRQNRRISRRWEIYPWQREVHMQRSEYWGIEKYKYIQLSEGQSQW